MQKLKPSVSALQPWPISQCHAQLYWHSHADLTNDLGKADWWGSVLMGKNSILSFWIIPLNNGSVLLRHPDFDVNSGQINKCLWNICHVADLRLVAVGNTEV